MPTLLPTSIVGSLPKPSWLAEPETLWSPWKLEGDALVEGKQDALRIGAVGHQMRHAPAQRVRLAGPRTGQHEQRAGFRRVCPGNTELDRLALLVVQLGQVTGRGRRSGGVWGGGSGKHGRASQKITV